MARAKTDVAVVLKKDGTLHVCEIIPQYSEEEIFGGVAHEDRVVMSQFTRDAVSKGETGHVIFHKDIPEKDRAALLDSVNTELQSKTVIKDSAGAQFNVVLEAGKDEQVIKG